MKDLFIAGIYNFDIFFGIKGKVISSNVINITTPFLSVHHWGSGTGRTTWRCFNGYKMQYIMTFHFAITI